MNIKEARAAIEAILAALPDEALPEFDKREVNGDGSVTVWWGRHGRCLGTAKSGGQRDPGVYRRDASWQAIQLEMTHRADVKHLAQEATS